MYINSFGRTIIFHKLFKDISMMCNESNRTISVSDGLWLFQMVSESALNGVPAKTLSPQRRAECEIPVDWRER